MERGVVNESMHNHAHDSSFSVNTPPPPPLNICVCFLHCVFLCVTTGLPWCRKTDYTIVDITPEESSQIDQLRKVSTKNLTEYVGIVDTGICCSHRITGQPTTRDTCYYDSMFIPEVSTTAGCHGNYDMWPAGMVWIYIFTFSYFLQAIGEIIPLHASVS